MLVGAIGLVGAGALMGLHARQISQVDRFRGTPYVRTFDHADSTLEYMLALGDGMAFAALAEDPTLSRPEVFRDGPDEAAYRAQRPVFGYLVFAGSLGQPELVPYVMVVFVLLSAGLAVAATAALIATRGGRPELALLSLIFPGTLSALYGLTPELLALALVLFGFIAWQSKAKALAITLFTVGALTRESMLLVPLALIALAIVRRDSTRREMALLTIPFAAFASWVLVLWIRFDAFAPTSASNSRLSLPFAGVVEAASEWTKPSQQVLEIAFGLLLILGAIVRSRRDVATVIVLIYAAFGSVMGVAVWRRWEDFGRPLLPLFVFSWVVVASGPCRAPSYTLARDSHPSDTPRIDR